MCSTLKRVALVQGASLAGFTYFGISDHLDREHLAWSEEEGSTVQAHFYLWDCAFGESDLPHRGVSLPRTCL